MRKHISCESALPHRGGTATCTEEARCEDCNWRYGATDPENHSYTWKAADGQYWQECERCGAVTAKQALPALTIVGPDKVCRTQDYTSPSRCRRTARSRGAAMSFR